MLKGFISLFTSLTFIVCTIFGLTGVKGTEHDDYKIYKNVILMIGDGMGFNTVEATKKLRQVDVSMETMPVIAQSKTRSATNKVTDSAAGGTALATGTRTYNGAIGVYILAPLANRYNVPKNLCELAIENGKSAGVVTTDKTSGATPGSFSAHSVERSNEKNISKDQMKSDLNLIWGAASESVTQSKCEENGFEYITTATQMYSLDSNSRSFAQFDFNAFASISNENDTPYISQMTSKAIEILNADEDGFFLMVEGAHIDKFSHSNNMEGATAQVVEFSKAVQVALDFAKADGNTLVVVTADHETGGITYDAEKQEYYYTKGGHTGVNVPVYVSSADAGFVNGEAYKNCQVSGQIARVMGFDKNQFPSAKV